MSGKWHYMLWRLMKEEMENKNCYDFIMTIEERFKKV